MTDYETKLLPAILRAIAEERSDAVAINALNHAAEALEKIGCLRAALEFYANRDNYWNTPLSLEGRYDRRTLLAVGQSKKGNKVLQDWGKIAREVLEKTTC